MIQHPRQPAARIARDAMKSIKSAGSIVVARYGPALGVVLAVIVLSTGAGPRLEAAESAEAAEAGKKYPLMSDKFFFTLGSFLTDFKTSASVGVGGVFGTFIQFEDDLGLDDDDTLFRVDGFYRFNERHSLDFGFWTFNRSGEAFIDEPIEFDGTTFEITGIIRSEFDTSWLRLGWRYSFLRNERGEAGLSLGLSTYKFDIALEGDVMIGMTTTRERAEDDLIAPVPTFGMFINYAITPRVIVKLNAKFLDLQIDDIDGKVIDTTFLIEWYFSRHVGVGLGINGTDIDIRDEGDDPFTVDYSVSGLMAYFTFSFGNVD